MPTLLSVCSYLVCSPNRSKHGVCDKLGYTPPHHKEMVTDISTMSWNRAPVTCAHRRKFRRQTYRCSNSGDKSQKKDRQERRCQRRERVRRKKIKVRKKVEKQLNTVFFQYVEAPEGRKVGSPKRRVRRHLVGRDMSTSKC